MKGRPGRNKPSPGEAEREEEAVEVPSIGECEPAGVPWPAEREGRLGAISRLERGSGVSQRF
jgi:hypothetical protein